MEINIDTTPVTSLTTLQEAPMCGVLQSATEPMERDQARTALVSELTPRVHPSDPALVLLKTDQISTALLLVLSSHCALALQATFRERLAKAA